MTTMIQDLLEYSRVQTRGQAFAPVALKTVLDEALMNLSVAMEEASAELSVEGVPPEIMGDESQLVRLLQNLIGNAVKYHDSSRPPKIRVVFQRSETEWMVSVIDNGIGVAEEHLDAIFGVFQRLHTRDEYEGTGIGLAVVKKIAERHGGRVRVESKPGEGSAFRFTLPVS